MRIISGQLGGRRISPPSKMPHTRPTTDIAKEGLFNTLQHLIDFENMSTLDLFGGTGCISYELYSRGASNLTLIEKDRKMASFIKSNIEKLPIKNAKVLMQDVFRFMKNCTESYDFIFAGPPYALATIDDIPNLVFEKKLLAGEGIFILEHTPRNNYEKHPNFFKVKNYGTTLFSFFENKD
jgi:16S rRNA (guanine(966)-N(2))-methyltransferase RsmD